MTGSNLSTEQRKFYAANGFIKLEQVFSPQEIAAFELAVSSAVSKLHEPNADKPPNSDSDAYAAAFTQVMNIWRHEEAVKALVFDQRLARLATELMDVSGVRLYHDQALYKEAHGGFTPWHCDQYYWPLDNDNTVTVWIPLQDTPAEMGPLAFSAGSHRIDLGRNLPIGSDSERIIAQELEAHALPFVQPTFRAGDISFHAGWTFHRAGPNATDWPRRAMTVIYMEDGIRLKAPENPNQQVDWQTWCPGARVGEPVATHLNPVLYRA
ncbi:MAG: phytanoyl-CoA dioxygenase family protein [Halioglobus sp.]